MAERVPRLSATFRRSLATAGVRPETPAFQAVFATLQSLTTAPDLPGPADTEIHFNPGRAHARRVRGQNLWLLYRFDAQHLYAMTTCTEPPMPAQG